MPLPPLPKKSAGTSSLPKSSGGSKLPALPKAGKDGEKKVRGVLGGFDRVMDKATGGLLNVAMSAISAPQQAVFKAGQGLGDMVTGHGTVGLRGLGGALGEVLTLGQAGGDIDFATAIGQYDETTGKHVPKKLPTGVNTAANVVADPLNFVTFGSGAVAKSALKAAPEVLGREATERLATQGYKKGLTAAEKKVFEENRLVEAALSGAKKPQKTVDKMVKQLETRGRGGVTLRVPGTRIAATPLSGDTIRNSRAGALGRTVRDAAKSSKPGKFARAALIPGARPAGVVGENAADELLDALDAGRTAETNQVNDLVTRWDAAVRDYGGIKKFKKDGADTAVHRALEGGIEEAIAARPELERLIRTADAMRSGSARNLEDAGVLDDVVTDGYAHRVPTDEMSDALRPGEETGRLYEGRGLSKSMNPGSAKARVVAPDSKVEEINEAKRLIDAGEDIPDGLLKDFGRVEEYQAPIQARIDDLTAQRDEIFQRNLVAREGTPTLGQERKMAADAEKLRRLDAQISREAKRLDALDTVAERAQAGVQAAGETRLGRIIGQGREQMEQAGQLDTGLASRRKQANLKAKRLSKIADKRETRAAGVKDVPAKAAPTSRAADPSVPDGMLSAEDRAARRKLIEKGEDAHRAGATKRVDPDSLDDLIARDTGRPLSDLRRNLAEGRGADEPLLEQVRRTGKIDKSVTINSDLGQLMEGHTRYLVAKELGIDLPVLDVAPSKWPSEASLMKLGAKAAPPSKAPGLTAASRAEIARGAADDAAEEAATLKGVPRAKSAKEVARDVNRRAGTAQAVTRGQADTAKQLTGAEARRQETALQRAVRERYAASEAAAARKDRFKNQAAARAVKQDEKALTKIQERVESLTDQLAEKAKLAEDDTRELVEAIAQKLPPGAKMYKESAVASLIETGVEAARAVETANMMRRIRGIKAENGVPILHSADDLASLGIKADKESLKAAGLVEFELPKLGKFYAHPAVKGEITKFNAVIEGDDIVDKSRKAINMWDRWWRGQVTAALPGGFPFATRNARTNVMLTAMDGMNPMYFKRGGDFQLRVRNVVKGHAAEIADDGVEATMKRHLGDRDFKVWKAAREHGVIGDGFYNIDISDAPEIRAAGMPKTGGKLRRGARFAVGSKGTLAVKGRALNQMVEQHARMSHFLYSIDRLGDLGEAAARTNTVLFDYGRVTPFEQKILKKVMPFWTFMRKNLPGQVRAFVENPIRVTTPEKLSALVSEPIDEDAPEYQRRAGAHVSRIPGVAGMVLTPERPFQAAISSLEPAAQMLGAVLPGNPLGLEPERGAPQAFRSLMSQLGGAPVAMGKAFADEASEGSMFTGGRLQPDEMRQRLLKAALPQLGRGPTMIAGRLPSSVAEEKTRKKAQQKTLAQIAQALGFKIEEQR